MNSTIRIMQASDMPDVWAIQCACYSDVLEPESQASLEAKRLASPESCFVAVHESSVSGYLIAMPWVFGQVPSLNATDCQLPAAVDCLYLHDMAVAPSMAHQGVGQQLYAAYQSVAQQLGYVRLALSAVGDAERYWSRVGFRPFEIPLNPKKIADYGGQITYMFQDC